MKYNLITIIAATMFTVGCASSPAKIVTATTDEVVVSISEEGAKNLNDSLSAAGKLANEACGKNKKMAAKFNRTEEVAHGLVARFDCVAAPMAPQS